MVVRVTAAPFLVVAGVGTGLSGMVKGIGKIFKSKSKEELKYFRM